MISICATSCFVSSYTNVDYILFCRRTSQPTRGVNMSIPHRRGKEAPPRQTGSEESEENVTDESEETSRSHDSDPPYGPDEIGHSQLPGAPTSSQRSPPAKRQARARDRTDIGSVNVLPTKPGRPVVKRNLTPPPIPPMPRHSLEVVSFHQVCTCNGSQDMCLFYGHVMGSSCAL